MNTRVEILIVEDSPSDAGLVLAALEMLAIDSHPTILKNGEEAMAYLRKEGSWTQAPTPDMILLDLNLPLKDGREVLAEIKQDPVLCIIPIVVMSTSASQKDVLRCYRLQANSYVVKALDIDTFLKDMRTLVTYWFKVVVRPDTRATNADHPGS